jgi:dihydrofolate reductase
MSRITAFIHLTLDGVMQAPGRPDEDCRDGFEQGGWAMHYNDADQAKAVGQSMANTGAILLGRRTYEDFYQVWPKRTESPFSAILNNTLKYVASRTLKEPLPWMNSKLLAGNAEDTVAELRQQAGKDIVILGSGMLVQSLLRHNLIDELMLTIHPIVLGSGRRLFPDGGAPAALRLVDSTATSKGVIIARYQPVETPAYGRESVRRAMATQP